MPSPVRRLACAAAVLLAAGATGAAAAPGWTDAKDVGAGYGPVVSVDADGKIVMTYAAIPTCILCGSDIEALVRPPGDDWRGPEHIGYTGYRGLYGMQTVADAHGGTVAVWEPGESSSGGGHLMTSSRPVGGPWTAPKDLSDPSYVGSYQLAVDRDGKAIAVWAIEPFTLDGGHVFAAVRPAGAADWQAPLELANPPVAGQVGVSLDAAGRALAVWQESGGDDGPRVVASTRPVGGPWSTPVPIVSAAVEDPHLGMSASGDAILAFVREGIPQVTERPVASGTWTAAKGLAAGQSASGLQLAVGADGSAAAVWTHADRIWGSVRSAGGGWSGATKLSDSVAYRPAVTVTDNGVAVAAWPTSAGSLETAVRAPGGTWSPARIMGPGDFPSLDADGAGDVVLAWGADGASIMSAVYDVTPPRISGVQVPSAATAGTPIAVSMSAPSDLWSAVPGIGWDFGDGATAQGLAASHTYAAAGTYTVTARAQDALGNAASETRQVTVAAAPPSPGVTFEPTGPRGTVGTVAGVVVALPGAGAGSTPAPAASGAARRRKPVRMRIVLPGAIRAGEKAVIGVRLNRPVHGALVRVQLRTGVRYRTVAQGRVSGRRVPVALAFAAPGRYLLRIQIREAGAKLVSRVTPVVVTR